MASESPEKSASFLIASFWHEWSCRVSIELNSVVVASIFSWSPLRVIFLGRVVADGYVMIPCGNSSLLLRFTALLVPVVVTALLHHLLNFNMYQEEFIFLLVARFYVLTDLGSGSLFPNGWESATLFPVRMSSIALFGCLLRWMCEEDESRHQCETSSCGRRCHCGGSIYFSLSLASIYISMRALQRRERSGRDDRNDIGEIDRERKKRRNMIGVIFANGDVITSNTCQYPI